MQTASVFLGNLTHLQLAWLAFALLVEGSLVAILPEEVIFISMGYFCRQGRVGWFEAQIFCQVGVLIANSVMMIAGRLVGRRLLGMPPFKWFLSEAALQRALSLVDRNGWKILAVNRFTPFVRGPVYLAAGLSRLPLKQCFAVDALASCFQVPLLLGAGYFAFERALDIYKSSKVPVLVAAFALVAYLVLRARRRHPRAPALTKL
jgi:membrane protein DedA with SNARE-associated domain